jgi:hypothetical protein
MSGSGERIVDVLTRALTPYLGANMARASARGHCDKLLLDATLTKKQLEVLIDSLRPALNVFVGRDKTEKVIEQIRRDVATGGMVT